MIVCTGGPFKTELIPYSLFHGVRRASGTAPFFFTRVEVHVEGQQALERDALEFVRRILKSHDGTDPDHIRADGADQVDGLFECPARTNDIVDDDRRVNVALADVLAELAFAVLHLCPIDLVGTEGLANAERDHDAARARTDH